MRILYHSAPKDGGINNTYDLQRVGNYIVYTNISDNLQITTRERIASDRVKYKFHADTSRGRHSHGSKSGP